MYRITFPDFKYEPPSFVFLEIGISSKALATPFMVQLVVMTKPCSPLRGGTRTVTMPTTSIEIIPLPI